MKRRLIAALCAGSAALDRLAQTVAAGEPDELEQVRVRIRKLERASADLQEWARTKADYSEWCEVSGSASQTITGDRLRANRCTAARKAGGAS